MSTLFSKLINKIRSLSFLIAVFLISCSKDFDKMSINEQAVYHPSRFSDDREKDRYRKPLEILNFAGVKPGDTVVDLLGGGGYYSELFNHIVGKDGKVYLQNNSLFLRFSKEQLEQRLQNARLANVVRLDSEYHALNLPQDVDMIFVGLSFHDFYVQREEALITADPESIFQQIHSALKMQGKLLVIDHAAQANSGTSTTSSLHRIDEQWLKQQMAAHGFQYVKSLEVLRNANDDYSKDIWKPEVYHKTDRFVHLYQKQSLE